MIKRKKSKGSTKKTQSVASSTNVHIGLLEASVDHVITTYLLPFHQSPIRPVNLSLKRQELYQHVYVVDQVGYKIFILSYYVQTYGC
jgi:hypothetical protein